MTITTEIVMGRDLTDAELSAWQNKLAELVSRGATNGVVTDGNKMDWIGEQVASEWLTLVRGFDPAPVSASLIVPERTVIPEEASTK